MDEIIRIFAKGLIRHLENNIKDSSSDKSSHQPRVRLDVATNERKVVRADNRYYLEKKGS